MEEDLLKPKQQSKTITISLVFFVFDLNDSKRLSPHHMNSYNTHSEYLRSYLLLERRRIDVFCIDLIIWFVCFVFVFVAWFWFMVFGSHKIYWPEFYSCFERCTHTHTVQVCLCRYHPICNVFFVSRKKSPINLIHMESITHTSLISDLSFGYVSVLYVCLWSITN